MKKWWLQIYYFQLRNLFAAKTLEKIISLEKSRKRFYLDISLPLLVLQVLDMPNYNDYYQTLKNYLLTLRLTKMTQTVNRDFNISEPLLINTTTTYSLVSKYQIW